MSTSIYLVCLSHDPPLVNDQESGQHLYDLPRLQAELADQPGTIAAWQAHEETATASDPWVGEIVWRDVSGRFFAQHPHCSLGVRDEYGAPQPAIASPPPPSAAGGCTCTDHETCDNCIDAGAFDCCSPSTPSRRRP